MKQNKSNSKYGNYGAINDLKGYLSLKQVERMINCADTFRDRLLLRLLSRTGRRVTEIVGRKEYVHRNKNKSIEKTYSAVKGIRPMDVDWESGMIVFNILKKKKPLRKLKPVDMKTLHMLDEYIQRNKIKPDEEIFKIGRRRVDQIVKKVAEKAGIYQVGTKLPHAHHFRHTFAVQTIKHGKSSDTLKKVQMALEHSSLAVTSDYLQFDQEELKTLLKDTFKNDDLDE